MFLPESLIIGQFTIILKIKTELIILNSNLLYRSIVNGDSIYGYHVLLKCNNYIYTYVRKITVLATAS